MPLSLLELQSLTAPQSNTPIPSPFPNAANAQTMQELIVQQMMTRGLSRQGATAFTQQRHVVMQNDQTRIFQLVRQIEMQKANPSGGLNPMMSKLQGRIIESTPRAAVHRSVPLQPSSPRQSIG